MKRWPPGASHPSILEGWELERDVYTLAHRDDRLAKLVTELSNACTLSCPGCFAKRAEGGWNARVKTRLPGEMSCQDALALIDEAAALGAATVDIVGAGEPMIDPNRYEIIDRILDHGMRAVIFTHGATPSLEADAERWAGGGVAFVVKLWSRDPRRQDSYVRPSDIGSSGYAEKRDRALERLINLGYNEGSDIMLDGVTYRTTRLGADMLVMKDNYDEIPDLFRFCRERNIMPEIKTFIPEGPTRFVQEQMRLYRPREVEDLRDQELEPGRFQELRDKLVRIDREESRIPDLQTVYPQGSKCTQSVGAIYVTVTGEIRSCVGSHILYGRYEPGKDRLREALHARKGAERVGFGCFPRLQDASQRGIKLPHALTKIYSDRG